MKVFLAYSENYHDILVEEKARLIVSYGRKHGHALEPTLPVGFSEYMIDSGGFQIAMKTTERDVILSGYVLYLQLLQEKYGDKIQGMMGLDTKNWDETLSNYEYMWKQGLTFIPVWKAFWSDEALDYLCAASDYVAMGGVAFGTSKEVLRHIWERTFLKHSKTKFHLLGVGIRGCVALRTFRCYSVDVSTWGVAARFGHDLVYDKKQGLKEVKLPDDVRQRLRTDNEFERQMIRKGIKTIMSLETELEELHDPLQSQMFVNTGV